MQLDYKTMPPEVAGRLERYVRSTGNPELQYAFLHATGRSQEVATCRLETMMAEIHLGGGRLDSLSYERLLSLRAEIGETEFKRAAEVMYSLAVQLVENTDHNTFGYNKIAIGIGCELGKPKSELEKLQYDAVLNTMLTRWSMDVCGEDGPHYVNAVKDNVRSIKELPLELPDSRLKEIAREAFSQLINSPDSENIFRAGLLAREYLDESSVLLAGEKFIKSLEKRVSVDCFNYPAYILAERVYRELPIPEKAIHPLMVQFFRYSLEAGGDAPATLQIMEQHEITPDEANKAANEAYLHLIRHGHVSNALRLRELYPGAVKEEYNLHSVESQEQREDGLLKRILRKLFKKTDSNRKKPVPDGEKITRDDLRILLQIITPAP